MLDAELGALLAPSNETVPTAVILILPPEPFRKTFRNWQVLPLVLSHELPARQ